MSGDVAIGWALLFLSAMLCAAMAVAWATLGRARHARTWACAFGCAAGQWAAEVAGHLLGAHAVLFVASTLFRLAAATLLAIGFRQRGRIAERRGLLAAGALATAALVFACTFAVPAGGIARATPPLFRAIVLATAAAVVGPRERSANAAERAAIAMLWGFVLFDIAVASLALTLGGGSGGPDRLLLLLGLPTAFAGTGMFALLLLAADLAERMRRLAGRDPLTGILNRRGFEEEATRAIANAARHGQPLSLALADLDRFKAVNDRHGHAAGDALLCGFAARIGEVVRQGDLFARVGGEEFVLLLVNTPGDAAVAVVDRLRREVARDTLPTDPPMLVTTSFGVAELAPGETALDTLLARADTALYRAKLDGRDRVCFAGA